MQCGWYKEATRVTGTATDDPRPFLSERGQNPGLSWVALSRAQTHAPPSTPWQAGCSPLPSPCLEVELPFLQSSLASFQIVPLVVGDALPDYVAGARRRLWGGPETLIVVSCDLSHYHPYEVAQRLDADTANAIEHGDWASLRPNQACGCLAVAGLLIEASVVASGLTGFHCVTLGTLLVRGTGS
jgi:hypothetical protein